MSDEPLERTARDTELSGAIRDGRSALSVTDRIREAILGGEIATGVRLNEVRLSQMMDVSRTPVRAALQALAGEGLLDYVPNRGFLVRTFPLSEIVDAYDIRAQLEGLATRFAAERGLTDQDRDVIERALADGDALLNKGIFETGDMSRYRIINGNFHDTILGAAKNRMLGEMIRICHHVPVSSNRNIVAFEHRNVRRRHDDHHRIYEAILSRETHRAEALMREHIAGIKSSLVNSLTRQEAHVMVTPAGAR
ncbi:MAG: GntR family transcriptional regulator [Pseudolabrys sp.]|nr:GntR family transcriptional regulator [Pseudolabrys sp.]